MLAPEGRPVSNVAGDNEAASSAGQAAAPSRTCSSQSLDSHSARYEDAASHAGERSRPEHLCSGLDLSVLMHELWPWLWPWRRTVTWLD